MVVRLAIAKEDPSDEGGYSTSSLSIPGLQDDLEELPEADPSQKSKVVVGGMHEPNANTLPESL